MGLLLWYQFNLELMLTEKAHGKIKWINSLSAMDGRDRPLLN
jgi:hypothetical protein